MATDRRLMSRSNRGSLRARQTAEESSRRHGAGVVKDRGHEAVHHGHVNLVGSTRPGPQYVSCHGSDVGVMIAEQGGEDREIRKLLSLADDHGSGVAVCVGTGEELVQDEPLGVAVDLINI